MTATKPDYVRVYEWVRDAESTYYPNTCVWGTLPYPGRIFNPADDTPEGAQAFREIREWLFDQGLWFSIIFRTDGVYHVEIEQDELPNSLRRSSLRRYRGHGPTEADALCAAIVAWKEAQE